MVRTLRILVSIGAIAMIVGCSGKSADSQQDVRTTRLNLAPQTLPPPNCTMDFDVTFFNAANWQVIGQRSYVGVAAPWKVVDEFTFLAGTQVATQVVPTLNCPSINGGADLPGTCYSQTVTIGSATFVPGEGTVEEDKDQINVTCNTVIPANLAGAILAIDNTFTQPYCQRSSNNVSSGRIDAFGVGAGVEYNMYLSSDAATYALNKTFDNYYDPVIQFPLMRTSNVGYLNLVGGEFRGFAIKAVDIATAGTTLGQPAGGDNIIAVGQDAAPRCQNKRGVTAIAFKQEWGVDAEGNPVAVPGIGILANCRVEKNGTTYSHPAWSGINYATDVNMDRLGADDRSLNLFKEYLGSDIQSVALQDGWSHVGFILLNYRLGGFEGLKAPTDVDNSDSHVLFEGLNHYQVLVQGAAPRDVYYRHTVKCYLNDRGDPTQQFEVSGVALP